MSYSLCTYTDVFWTLTAVRDESFLYFQYERLLMKKIFRSFAISKDVSRNKFRLNPQNINKNNMTIDMAL